jgi:hypothetical protein
MAPNPLSLLAFSCKTKKQKAFDIDPAQTEISLSNKHQTIIANLKPAENQRYPAEGMRKQKNN